jgi:hypothetical protein
MTTRANAACEVRARVPYFFTPSGVTKRVAASKVEFISNSLCPAM